MKSKTLAIELMPKLSVATEQRVTRIAAYHQGVIRAFGQQMGYAFLGGLELIAAKEEATHGAWLKWCEHNLEPLGISYRTASRYMSLAEGLLQQSAQLARFAEGAGQKLLSNGELDVEEIKLISTAVHDATDGKTLTEMYRDLGVIKQPQHQKDRPRGDKLTPEEQEDAKNKGAADLYQSAINFLESINSDIDAQGRAPADLRNRLIEACVTASTRERSLLKAAKSKQKATKATKKGGRK